MTAFQGGRWSALAIAFGISTSMARAEMITPNSIPNPPSAVASADNTPVFANNLVTTQYKGLGLHFLNAVAITQLNNTSVWAPITRGSQDTISYNSSVGGIFVGTGSLTPTTVSSVTVDLIGLTGAAHLEVASELNGSVLNIVPVLQNTPGPDGGQLWTFTGPGIGSFGITSPTGSWGVSGVSFMPTPAPEPSSLVLAALGALGLAARFGRRRYYWP